MADNFNMGELLDDLPITRKKNPDVVLQTERSGKGGGNGGKTANADEVVHLCGDEKYFQEVPPDQLRSASCKKRSSLLCSVWKWDVRVAK